MALGKCGRVPGLWKWPEVHADAQTCVNRGGHGRVFAGLVSKGKELGGTNGS